MSNNTPETISPAGGETSATPALPSQLSTEEQAVAVMSTQANVTSDEKDGPKQQSQSYDYSYQVPSENLNDGGNASSPQQQEETQQQQQQSATSEQEAERTQSSSTDTMIKKKNDVSKLNQQQQSSPDDSFDVDWTTETTLFGHKRYLFRELLDVINQFRYNCGMLVNNGHVQFFIIMLIAINGIMMGIATFDFVSEDEQISEAFETVDLIFLIIFTVELGLQFVYHSWRLFLDGWLVFDLVIITTSWLFSSVQIIRAFRIFRALRLVTRIKIMKNLILGE